ncbi:Multicopper oxidase with three cupredoxin domains (includes cell division protein FtsP and spore coat protein CotA) [Amycolatopsis sacchari]|uniref:Multicopper oxidase with three cupredoxin domains (Includes cell division protein FtsP and spore coat protein CotA) n=1 Tax=Amycolatopsis sacchari TaxID=115433 RepID=A0A1I3UYS8_9PSEU|nr:multicopper oxidase domain-containing protein [Amycolatopsis sacchari]SFJ87913.1 Multicopper oxidase with three cupredoxin domains (includes cell division protein FtsP and spore coat protein CotA) [Amycolatopsis sacchari]
MTEVIAQPVPVTAPGFGLTKFLDPLRIPSVIGPHLWWRQEEVTIKAVRTRVRLHSQLPETEVWAYEGEFPGPTIEVRSGKRLRVAWTNDADGTIPLVAVQGPIAQAPGTVPGGYRDANGQLLPGFSLIDGVADLPAWQVVHLHGAMTNGGNDGWAHNAVLRGNAQLAEYPNGQQSTTMWYHDHAMAVTRFNVHAGLAGMYLIRDAEEDALNLPHGRHEIPLVLCDRNLDTDPATGALTGQLLFKIGVAPSGAPIPFTGPFNLVNGVIWPHLEVDTRWYRFRVLNASNSRFYRLNLVDEAGVAQHDAVRIIGTDGGLLPTPAPVPEGGLTLAPAERADVLIDFSRFAGQRLRLTDASAQGGPTEPDLMEFRVEDSARHDPFRLPERLSSSYVRLQHGTTVPEDHDHVFVALVPPGTAGEAHPQMWELRELTEAPPSLPAEGVLQVKDPATGEVRTFERVAALFDDTTTFFIDHGRWAVWNFLHFGGPTHPLHIHMAQFQLLTRRAFSLAQGNVAGFDVATGGTVAPLEVPPPGRPIERYEEGWKDTFQVAAGEWITVAGRHEGATGEFMYRCHILDHEDEGMMRPFVVHPPEVARFHVHPGGGHGGHEH